jgi:transposase-like protein
VENEVTEDENVVKAFWRVTKEWKRRRIAELWVNLVEHLVCGGGVESDIWNLMKILYSVKLIFNINV